MKFNNIVHDLNRSVYLKILCYLLPHTEGLSGNALAKLTGVSAPKANMALHFLVSQGVLSYRIVGKSYLYRVCREHVLVEKILLPQLEFQKNIFASLGRFIAKQLKPCPLSIILYGSMARSEEKPDSDIDVLLVYPDSHTSKNFNDYDQMINAVRRRFGNSLSVRRGLAKQLRERYKSNDPLITNIVKEGKVIYGKTLLETIKYGKNNQTHGSSKTPL